MGCGDLRKSARVRLKGCIWSDFRTNLRLMTLTIPLARYTTSTGTVRRPWYLKDYFNSACSRGIQHNVDEPQDAAVSS